MDHPRGGGGSSRRGTVHRQGEIVEAIRHDYRRSSDAQYLTTDIERHEELIQAHIMT